MAGTQLQDLGDDECRGVDGGISMKVEALELYLVDQSVQMRSREVNYT